jgi:hypothetical protein
MSTRSAIILAVIAAFCFCGCDVNFNGYAKDHPKEDWDSYDYVFSGPSPDSEGLDMLVKLNIADDDLVTGEVMGVFYSKLDGALSGSTLELVMPSFVDNQCVDPGNAAFAGQIVDGKLIGHFTVWSCIWYEFDFEGELAGGRVLD